MVVTPSEDLKVLQINRIHFLGPALYCILQPSLFPSFLAPGAGEGTSTGEMPQPPRKKRARVDPTVESVGIFVCVWEGAGGHLLHFQFFMADFTFCNLIMIPLTFCFTRRRLSPIVWR